MNLRRIVRNIVNFFVPIKSFRKKINRIFSSEISLKNMPMAPYQSYSIARFNDKYSFKDKVVLEIGSDLKLNTARGILKLGAKKVYAVNPGFPDNIDSLNDKIVTIKSLGEKTNLPDGSCDIIFGIALLEHVAHPKELALECKRLLKPDGVCFLSGWPMWTSSLGHHVHVRNKNGKEYYFNQEDCPIEDWAQLVLSKEEMIKNLLEKNIPEEDCKLMVNMVYGSAMSELSPSKIISDFESVPGVSIAVNRAEIPNFMPNQYYERAKSSGIYSEEDLKTIGLDIYLTKEN